MRTKPELLGAFALAFLVNLLAYPFFLGLLPYVAKDVYGSDRPGSAGSPRLSGRARSSARWPSARGISSGRAARVMLWNGALWFAGLLVFGQVTWLAFGIVLLFAIGLVQSFC